MKLPTFLIIFLFIILVLLISILIIKNKKEQKDKQKDKQREQKDKQKYPTITSKKPSPHFIKPINFGIFGIFDDVAIPILSSGIYASKKYYCGENILVYDHDNKDNIKIYQDNNCKFPTSLNTLFHNYVNTPEYYSSIEDIFFKINIQPSEFQNYLYIELIGPLMGVIQSSNEGNVPQMSDPLLTKNLPNLQVYEYRRNQIFFIYTKESNYPSVNLYVFNEFTNNFLIYQISRINGVFQIKGELKNSNFFLCNQPRDLNSGNMTRISPFLYIGPELNFEIATLQPKIINTFFQPGSTKYWTLVNGYFTFPYLNNYVNVDQNSGTLVLRKLKGDYLINLSYNLLTSNTLTVSSEIENKNSGLIKNQTVSFKFSENENMYVSIQESPILIFSNVKSNMVRQIENNLENTSVHFFTFINEDNQTEQVTVYKNSDFYFPRNINSFFDQYTIPQNLVLASLNEQIIQTYDNSSKFIYIELLGTLRGGFSKPNQNGTFENFETFQSNFQIFEIIANKVMLLYFKDDKDDNLLPINFYVFNPITKSLLTYVILFSAGKLVLKSTIDDLFLNYYYDQGTSISNFFINPLVLLSRRIIIGPETASLRGFGLNSQVEYLDQGALENEFQKNNSITVIDSQTGQSFQKYVYSEDSKFCVDPNSMVNVFENNLFLFKMTDLPSLFQINPNMSYLFISILGDMKFGFREPTIEGIFDDYALSNPNLPNLPNLQIFKYDDKNIAIPTTNLNNLTNLTNLTLWVYDNVSNTTLKYILNQTNNVMNIAIDYMSEIGNYLLKNNLSNNLSHNFLFIGPPIQKNAISESTLDDFMNKKTENNEKIQPTPDVLAKLPKISNPTCPNKQTFGKTLLSSAEQFRLPNSDPTKPNYLPPETFISTLSQEEADFLIDLQFALQTYEYNPVCPFGYVTTKDGEGNIQCVPETPCLPTVLPNSSNLSNCTCYNNQTCGGLDSCQEENCYLEKFGENISTIWRLVNENDQTTTDYSLKSTGINSFVLIGLNELNGLNSLKVITDDKKSVIKLQNDLKLSANSYYNFYTIKADSIFFLDIKTNRYKFTENETIYFYPINCQNSCISLENNDKNCGACGKACGENEKCCGKKCIPVQEYNLSYCQNICRNDPSYCQMTILPTKQPVCQPNCLINCGELNGCGGYCNNTYFNQKGFNPLLNKNDNNFKWILRKGNQFDYLYPYPGQLENTINFKPSSLSSTILGVYQLDSNSPLTISQISSDLNKAYGLNEKDTFNFDKKTNIYSCKKDFGVVQLLPSKCGIMK